MSSISVLTYKNIKALHSLQSFLIGKAKLKVDFGTMLIGAESEAPGAEINTQVNSANWKNLNPVNVIAFVK
jgi:hypothetical protein